MHKFLFYWIIFYSNSHFLPIYGRLLLLFDIGKGYFYFSFFISMFCVHFFSFAWFLLQFIVVKCLLMLYFGFVDCFYVMNVILTFVIFQQENICGNLYPTCKYLLW